ncbi:hypothetical protein BX666DRAFT_962527 [Dichotomocladium elegans]|nr:hypothetical protein BX666DRAFT_962527 [Dichotomocladium elegans]
MYFRRDMQQSSICERSSPPDESCALLEGISSSERFCLLRQSFYYMPSTWRLYLSWKMQGRRREDWTVLRLKIFPFSARKPVLSNCDAACIKLLRRRLFMDMDRRTVSARDPRTKDRRRTYRDQGVCIDYLCGLCPVELTRGHPCGREHNDQLRTEYELDVRQDRSKAMDKEHLANLEKFLSLRYHDADVWKARLRDLARKNHEVDRARLGFEKIHNNAFKMLNGAEKLAADGKLPEAREALENARSELKGRKDLEIIISRTFTAPHQKEPALDICVTCGIFYLISSSEAHTSSRQHIAYDEIRKAVLEIRTRLGIPQNQKIGHGAATS